MKEKQFSKEYLERTYKLRVNNIKPKEIARKFNASLSAVYHAIHSKRNYILAVIIRKYIDDLPLNPGGPIQNIAIPNVPVAKATPGEITRKFELVDVIFLEKEGQLWITMEQLGTILGYSDPIKGISNIYNRHKDILKEFSMVLNLRSITGEHQSIVFNEIGTNIIALKSSTPTAKRFVIWVARLVADYRNGTFIQESILTQEEFMFRELKKLRKDFEIEKEKLNHELRSMKHGQGILTDHLLSLSKAIKPSSI